MLDVIRLAGSTEFVEAQNMGYEETFGDESRDHITSLLDEAHERLEQNGYRDKADEDAATAIDKAHDGTPTFRLGVSMEGIDRFGPYSPEGQIVPKELDEAYKLLEKTVDASQMEIIGKDRDQYELEVKGSKQQFEKLYQADENSGSDALNSLEPESEFYNLKLVRLEDHS